MILNHYLFDEEIDFADHPVRQLIIESPGVLGTMVSELRQQIEGGSGDFFLCDADRDIAFDKFVSLIVDPFEADPNSKPIINGLIRSLVSSGLSDENYVTTEETITSLIRYCQDIAFKNGDDVVMNPPSIESIFRMIRPELPSSVNLNERISDYVSLISRYTDNKLLILVNISVFISADDYHDLVRQLVYHQHPVLMIEYNDTPYLVPKKIIDADLCEINVP